MLDWLNRRYPELPLRLHLGCGDFLLPHGDGWYNIDQRGGPGVDRVDNIGMLRRFPAGCADVIYCSHALDHFSRWEYVRVLERWHEILRPNGELWISTIDFAIVAELYSKGQATMRELTGALAAAQDYPSNVRHVHFDQTMLTEDLHKVGFKTTYRTEDAFFLEDCSAAKIGEQHISLNVIATK